MIFLQESLIVTIDGIASKYYRIIHRLTCPKNRRYLTKWASKSQLISVPVIGKSQSNLLGFGAGSIRVFNAVGSFKDTAVNAFVKEFSIFVSWQRKGTGLICFSTKMRRSQDTAGESLGFYFPLKVYVLE